MSASKNRSYYSINLEIGERIRAARNRAGLRLDELAEVISKSPITMHGIETGKVGIKAAHVALIALALKCTVRSLFPKGMLR